MRAPVGKVRLVLTVVSDDASTRDGSLIYEIVREGARRMLAAALEAEVDAYIAELAEERDERGRHLVVRNGQTGGRCVKARNSRSGHTGSPGWSPSTGSWSNGSTSTCCSGRSP